MNHKSSSRIPRKYTLHAHGQQVVFRQGAIERPEHVYMKAFLWALYLPDYPDLTVEVRIGDRYKPDVVSIDEESILKDVNAGVRFWGEAGRVSIEKVESLVRRYPNTHFALTKWGKDLKPIVKYVQKAINGRKRTAPFDLIRFRDGDAERFIDDGVVTVAFEEVEWVRL